LTVSNLRTPSRTPSASRRSQKLGVSGIRLIFERAQSFSDVIRLEFGEPDFDTPQNIKDAAARAISTGKTKYTSGSGLMELRQAISAKFERENGIYYDPSTEVIVSSGATMGINLALLSTLDEGDEILVPNPGWATYAYAVKLVGATPILYDLEPATKYSFRRERVERLVTKKTRAILINSPSNPMGSVLSREDVKSVANFARDLDLYVLSDEVYEKFLYPEPSASNLEHVSIASLSEMKERVLTINSFSKTYAMTGWRVGYVGAPSELAQAMAKINTAATSCISSISQYAALEALEGPQDSVRKMVDTYRKRRDVTVKGLNEIPGFDSPVPRGAFYAFPRVSIDNLTSLDIALKILDKVHVATVPGSAFGSNGEGHLRIAYANSIENIRTGLERIATMVRGM
jgi:aspartate/methionine/tyrosine aminotransferase